MQICKVQSRFANWPKATQESQLILLGKVPPEALTPATIPPPPPPPFDVRRLPLVPRASPPPLPTFPRPCKLRSRRIELRPARVAAGRFGPLDAVAVAPRPGPSLPPRPAAESSSVPSRPPRRDLRQLATAGSSVGPATCATSPQAPLAGARCVCPCLRAHPDGSTPANELATTPVSHLLARCSSICP